LGVITVSFWDKETQVVARNSVTGGPSAARSHNGDARKALPGAPLSSAIRGGRQTPYAALEVKTSAQDAPGATSTKDARIDTNPSNLGAPESHVELAAALAAQGRFDDAEAILEGLAVKEKSNAHIHARLAHIQRRKGDLSAAENSFRRAIEIDHGATGFHIELAAVLAAQSRFGEAKAILEDLAANEKSNPDIHVRLAQIQRREGDLTSAENSIRRAIEIDPEAPGFHVELAEVHAAQGRFGEAKGILERLAANGKSKPDIHVRLAQIQRREGDLSAAENSIRRAIEIDPGAPGFHTELAEVLAAQGRFGEAKAILEGLAAKEKSNPHIHARLAHIQKREGDLSAAEASFRRAIEIDPGATGFHIELAAVLAAQAWKSRDALTKIRRGEAKAILEALAAKEKSRADIPARLANIQWNEGDLSSAEKSLRRAIELDPSVTQFHLELVRLLEAQGRFDEGRGMIEGLVRGGCSDPDTLARFINMQLRDGDFEGGEEAFNKAMSFEERAVPPNRDYRSKLVTALSTSKYALQNMKGKPCYRESRALMSLAISQLSVEGLILEFGVYTGGSIIYIAERLKNHKIYGFDSFQGLPEDWGVTAKKGQFAVDKLPALKENIELVVGWFDETLPTFVKQRSGPISLLHIDCDLYSSTKTIFDNLNDWIVPGTVIVFDEYFNYPGWELHEFKALQEFREANRVSYEYLGLVPTGQQVAVRITQRA
jgi:Tfp pilus assembly protein PilF/predicted O-methyltransferase YrrM